MHTFKNRVFAALALLTSVGVVMARDTEVNDGHDVAARQVILQIKTALLGTPLANVIQQLTALGGADAFRPLNRVSGTYLLHSNNNNVAALLNVLKNHPALAFVEPDYIVKNVDTPNDPYFPQQPDMYNSAAPGVDIGATLAWAISTGSTANVIGVVDTGVQYTHPDLAGNIWSAPSSFTVTLSWGQLTCPAGSHGYNAITRLCDPADDNGHGTHTSGTVGAIGNNGVGVAGVNWTTRIMALKFLDAGGSGSISDAIDAIEFGLQAKTIFGAGANLRVLSNSWGGSGFSQALLNEINKANTADVLFVAAAGNSSANDDTAQFYPAAYTAPNMITVAATTSTDGLASFSNYGPSTVHLGAPGVNILSTYPTNTYAYLSGTSMATPHVSGAAMLVLSKCALTTAGVRNAILANVDPIASLQGITTTGGRLDVNRAIRSCVSGPANGSATFLKTDSSTFGSWKGVYGAEGYNVINDSANTPAYVTVTPSGNGAYTWLASTTDTRALQKGSSTDRIAACWYSGSSFSVNLTFNDSNSHQVALYLLDWEMSSGGRTERVDILDGNGNLLDTRLVSGFGNGQYLVWNLSGHVSVRITNTNSSTNAVMSGLFFGGAGSGGGGGAGTAAFLKTDSSTSGSWKGVYGAEGYNVINDSANTPAYVTVTPSGNGAYTWLASTSDTRALQKGAATDRIAACWYSGSNFSVNLTFNDTNTHQVALYLLDWDMNSGGRTERVDILDGNGNILDTRLVSGFGSGQYLVWNLSGHVSVRITNTNGATNAVMSGLFFGGAGSGGGGGTGTAAFLKTDSSTSGSWKGVYGADGYNVINDSASTPAYVTVTPSGNNAYTWLASTSDPRALQKGSSSTDRIAACWYAASVFSVDLTFKDSNTHQVALYLLDWDMNGGGRTESVDILDGNGNVLDTRPVSGFGNGQYLVWNVSGHVVVRVTKTNASSNAVMSGLFFR